MINALGHNGFSLIRPNPESSDQKPLEDKTSSSFSKKITHFGKEVLKGDLRSSCALLATITAARYILLQPSWGASGFAAAQMAAITPLMMTYGALALTLIGGALLTRYAFNSSKSQALPVVASAAGIYAGQKVTSMGQGRSEAGIEALNLSPKASKATMEAASALSLSISSYISYQALSHLTGDKTFSKGFVATLGIGLGAYRVYNLFSGRKDPEAESVRVQRQEALDSKQTTPIREISTGMCMESAGLVMTVVAVYGLARAAKSHFS